MEITLSERARAQILCAGKNAIFIEFYEGGCAGYRYKFSFKPVPLQVLGECGGILVGLHGPGVETVASIQIDYEASLMGSRFYIQQIDGMFCKCSASFGKRKPIKSC